MAELFVRVVNMSITASIVALLLLALRYLVQDKLPATFCYLLWGTVFFRLLVPWSLPAALSIFNVTGGDLPQPTGGYVVTLDYVESGYVPVHAPDTRSIFLVLSAIWLTVAVLLGLYVLLVNWYVRHKARTVFPLRECDELLAYCKTLVPVRQRVRVYHSSAFPSPVVLGSLHPRIILPSSMDFSNRRMMIHIFTHELTHIRRMDFLTKKLALLSVVVHWFNPLVLLCYHLFSRDIEASCDERVLSVLGEEEKVGY
ncbi:MAG: M56 family metallopeptidase, partial [Angelakisella sp.]